MHSSTQQKQPPKLDFDSVIIFFETAHDFDKLPCHVFVDANCIEIRAPLIGGDVNGAIFNHGQHIGHVAKDCARVMAHLMDAGHHGSSVSSDCCTYYSGFLFKLELSYSDTNRTKLGYDVDIIVCSENSAPWVASLFSLLRDEGLKPSLIL